MLRGLLQATLLDLAQPFHVSIRKNSSSAKLRDLTHVVKIHATLNVTKEKSNFYRYDKTFGESSKQVFCQTAINDERLILNIHNNGIKI